MPLLLRTTECQLHHAIHHSLLITQHTQGPRLRLLLAHRHGFGFNHHLQHIARMAGLQKFGRLHALTPVRILRLLAAQIQTVLQQHRAWQNRMAGEVPIKCRMLHGNLPALGAGGCRR